MPSKAQKPGSETTHPQQHPLTERAQTIATPPEQSHPVAGMQQARIAPRLLTPRDVLQLQRTIGNRAVGRLLRDAGTTESTIPAPPVAEQPANQSTIQRVITGSWDNYSLFSLRQERARRRAGGKKKKKGTKYEKLTMDELKQLITYKSHSRLFQAPVQQPVLAPLQQPVLHQPVPQLGLQAPVQLPVQPPVQLPVQPPFQQPVLQQPVPQLGLQAPLQQPVLAPLQQPVLQQPVPQLGLQAPVQLPVLQLPALQQPAPAERIYRFMSVMNNPLQVSHFFVMKNGVLKKMSKAYPVDPGNHSEENMAGDLGAEIDKEDPEHVYVFSTNSPCKQYKAPKSATVHNCSNLLVTLPNIKGKHRKYYLAYKQVWAGTTETGKEQENVITKSNEGIEDLKAAGWIVSRL